MSIWQNIIKVARRELRIIRNRPLYLLGSVGVITFCALFYLTLMKDGLPHDIPIGIVDQDESTTSRNFYQQLDATQLGKVVHYDTYESARADLMSGKILAMCVLPKGMNDDIQASRQPKITMYTNGLYLVGGALAWKQLLYMVNLTNGAVQREALRMRGYDEQQIMGLIQPEHDDELRLLPLKHNASGSGRDDRHNSPDIFARHGAEIRYFQASAQDSRGFHYLRPSGQALGVDVDFLRDRIHPHSAAVPLAALPYRRLDMEHVPGHVPDDSGKRKHRHIHSGNAASAAARSQHRRPLQHAGLLAGRLHPAYRSHASLHSGTGRGLPFKALLQLLRARGVLRSRIRRLVERSCIPSHIPVPACDRPQQAEESIYLSKFSKGIKGYGEIQVIFKNLVCGFLAYS